MNKESFVFYKSFYEAIGNLPDENQLELYQVICEYSFNGNLLEMSGIVKAMFILMKPNIDNANARYNANIENGKKGGRPKTKPNNNPTITQTKPNNNPSKTETKPNDNLNVYVYDNVYDNDNVYVYDNKDDKKGKKKFVKPSIQEIKSYCIEINSNIDIENFFDYYESNGWKVGNNTMKDWKATVRNWSRKEKPQKSKFAQNVEDMLKEFGG